MHGPWPGQSHANGLECLTMHAFPTALLPLVCVLRPAGDTSVQGSLAMDPRWIVDPRFSCPPTSWTHLPRSLAPFKVQNSLPFSPAPIPSSLPSPNVGCLARAGIAEVLDAHLHDYSRQVAATRGSQAALQASLDRLEVCRPCQVHADAVLAPLCIVWDHSTHRPPPCAAAG